MVFEVLQIVLYGLSSILAGIGPLIILSYNICLYILLLHLIIDIAISSCFSSRFFLSIVDLLIIMASIGSIFCDFRLGLSSAIGTFFFIKDVSFMGHLVNSFALFSDLSMYNSFAMTTCFIYRA